MTEKGIRGLTVTFDSFDGVVVNELKAIIQGILDNPWEGHHDYKESLKDVDSFLRAVSWYMKSRDYKEYYESLMPLYEDLVEKAFPKNPDLDITILGIRDLPDGGASIEYETSPEMREFLMGVGFKKILEDACKDVVNKLLGPEPKVYTKFTDVPGWEYF